MPLDPEIPGWGDSRYVDLRLTGVLRLADALNHLYVLLPVLDDAKHYWVGSDEVDKLIRAGEGWLGAHPEKDLISHRYLAHRRYLADTALERLAEADGLTEPEAVPDDAEGPVSLAVERRTTVAAVLKELGARRIADLGCGEGALVGELLKDPMIGELFATDVSARALIGAKRRLHYDDLPDRQRERLRFLQSSVTYADHRLAGLDAAVLMEVIEHVDPPRLPALAKAVFQAARPAAVIVTTPNSEYNVRFDSLPAGEFRHPDHRFEWTREEFHQWASWVSAAVRLCGGVPSGRRGRSGRRSADPARPLQAPGEGGRLMAAIRIPALSLVVLVGASGSGKSTFARKHFKGTEVISSDFCRGLVSDDENDQAASKDAFEVLNFIAGKRLAAGRLTVIDATNVQPEARKELVALAREHDVLPVAIVLDPPERVCVERNEQRPDRQFGAKVISQATVAAEARSAQPASVRASAPSTCSTASTRSMPSASNGPGCSTT